MVVHQTRTWSIRNRWFYTLTRCCCSTRELCCILFFPRYLNIRGSFPHCCNVSLGKLDGRSREREREREIFENFERRNSLLKDRYPAADWNGRAEAAAVTRVNEACTRLFHSHFHNASHFRKWIDLSEVERRLRIIRAALVMRTADRSRARNGSECFRFLRVHARNVIFFLQQCERRNATRVERF